MPIGVTPNGVTQVRPLKISPISKSLWNSRGDASNIASIHTQEDWLRQEAVLRTLTEDVLNSSEIEGEKLDEGQVRSSSAPSKYGCWGP
jgi:hypothetical protein